MTVHFVDTDRSFFDALAARFGLKCTRFSDREIRYENARANMTVHFDPVRSFELGVEVGAQADSKAGPAFSLAEILRLRKSPESTYVDGLTVTNQQSLKRALARLTGLIEEFAAELLSGDEAMFAELARQREAESVKYELQTKLKRAISDANTAWQVGNFPAVVAALSPLENALSDAEKKRLAIARKRAILPQRGQ